MLIRSTRFAKNDISHILAEHCRHHTSPTENNKLYVKKNDSITFYVVYNILCSCLLKTLTIGTCALLPEIFRNICLLN